MAKYAVGLCILDSKAQAFDMTYYIAKYTPYSGKNELIYMLEGYEVPPGGFCEEEWVLGCIWSTYRQ
jgi:hypothetical protein